jgi:Rrf2 family protein
MISNRTINALDVCVVIAELQHKGRVSTTTLSNRLKLSVSNLESILKPLKDHHIVSANKGPGGGYNIQGDIALVSMWDIASAFENTLEQQDNESDGLSAPASFEWGLEQVVIDTLSQFVLADFVDLTAVEAPEETPVLNRFKLKPMAPPLIPKAPNSVFQLSMTV